MARAVLLGNTEENFRHFSRISRFFVVLLRGDLDDCPFARR